MSRRCQHNHHRPKVRKGRKYVDAWTAECRHCGWCRTFLDWHTAVVYALAHSRELTS